MTSRPIMVDAVLDGVLTTRLASRCGISTPKVGTATQLSNPSDLFAWLDRFHNAPDQLSQDQRCSKKRSRLNGYFAAVEAQELYEEGRRGIGTWDDQAAGFDATVDDGVGGVGPLGYRIWRPRSGHRAWMVIALGCWSSRTRLDGHLMLNCDCQLKIQLRVGVVSLFCGWIWSIMESVSNGLSHNQARCRLLAWQDIENARKKACSPGVALGLLHAVDLFEARLSRSRRHLPRRGSFTRRPMPRTSMATRGRRSRTRLASRCGISTRRACHLDAASQGVGMYALYMYAGEAYAQSRWRR